MKITKFLTAPVLTLMFAAAGFAAALNSSTTQITPYDVIVNSPTVVSGILNTDESWQTIVLPISALGGSVPADLALDTSGLPEGLSVDLANVTQDGNNVVLRVDVTRGPSNAVPHGLAEVSLASGGTTLTTFQVPVVNLVVSRDSVE